MDYRKNKKVILTLKLEDKGQDFTEIDVLENGVILGNSPMFADGRLSLIGIGRLDGMKYITDTELLNIIVTKRYFQEYLKASHIYIKPTSRKKNPPIWEEKILNYRIIGYKKPTNPDRFIIK